MNINPLYQLVISVVILFVTQGVKSVQAIPINEGQKVRIRAFVGVATFVLTALIAWLDGNLESVLSPQMIEVIVATGASWLIAHLGYKNLLNR